MGAAAVIPSVTHHLVCTARAMRSRCDLVDVGGDGARIERNCDRATVHPIVRGWAQTDRDTRESVH